MNLPFVRPRYAWAVKLPCMRFVLYGTILILVLAVGPLPAVVKERCGNKCIEAVCPDGADGCLSGEDFPSDSAALSRARTRSSKKHCSPGSNSCVDLSLSGEAVRSHR